jgi:hypothetical protein
MLTSGEKALAASRLQDRHPDLSLQAAWAAVEEMDELFGDIVDDGRPPERSGLDNVRYPVFGITSGTAS